MDEGTLVIVTASHPDTTNSLVEGLLHAAPQAGSVAVVAASLHEGEADFVFSPLLARVRATDGAGLCVTLCMDGLSHETACQVEPYLLALTAEGACVILTSVAAALLPRSLLRLADLLVLGDDRDPRRNKDLCASLQGVPFGGEALVRLRAAAAARKQALLWRLWEGAVVGDSTVSEEEV